MLSYSVNYPNVKLENVGTSDRMQPRSDWVYPNKASSARLIMYEYIKTRHYELQYEGW